MSNDDESNVATVGLLLLVLFLVACFKSWQEFRYLSAGKETKATVTNIAEDRNKRGKVTGHRVHYRFSNENTNKRVKGYTIVGPDDVHLYHAEQELEIQYYGGTMFTSRIKGTGSIFWPALTGLTVVGTVGAIVWLNARAKTPR